MVQGCNDDDDDDDVELMPSVDAKGGLADAAVEEVAAASFSPLPWLVPLLIAVVVLGVSVADAMGEVVGFAPRVPKAAAKPGNVPEDLFFSSATRPAAWS